MKNLLVLFVFSLVSLFASSQVVPTNYYLVADFTYEDGYTTFGEVTSSAVVAEVDGFDMLLIEDSFTSSVSLQEYYESVQDDDMPVPPVKIWFDQDAKCYVYYILNKRYEISSKNEDYFVSN